MDIIWRIFVSPRAAFEKAREPGGFAVPFLTLIVLSLLALFLEIPAVVETARKAVMANPKADMSLFNANVILFTGYISMILGIVVKVFIGAVFLLLVNLIVRGEAAYMQLAKVMALASYPGLLSALISGVWVRAAGITDVKAATLNLGLLLPARTGWTYALAALANPFSLWELVLIVIGTCTMTRRPKTPVALWIVLGWAILSLLAVLAAALQK